MHFSVDGRNDCEEDQASEGNKSVDLRAKDDYENTEDGYPTYGHPEHPIPILLSPLRLRTAQLIKPSIEFFTRHVAKISFFHKTSYG